MMPLAPMPVIPVPTKPKMGFTIESLVGKGKWPTTATAAAAASATTTAASAASAATDNDSPTSSPGGSRPSSSISGESDRHEDNDDEINQQMTSDIRRTTTAAAAAAAAATTAHSPRSLSPVSPMHFSGPSSPPLSSTNTLHVPTASMASPLNGPFMHEALKGIYAPEPTYSNGGLLLGHHPHQQQQQQQQQQHHHHHQPHPHHPHHPHHHHHHHGHHHQPLPLHAHMSHQLQSGFPAAALSPLFLGNIGTVGPHQLHRDAYPLYPWLLSRQGRFLGHRFQGPDAPAFLLQPFRKPKRIRTAFSPSQLLKLEHAFEKNHYVVGAERKHLAQTLSLTETQVKVWFQNRRTKHKRLKQEEEQTQSSPPSPKKKGTHHLNKWKMETNQSGDENSSEAS